MRKWWLAICVFCCFEAAAQEHDDFADLNSAALEELAETEDHVNDDEHNAQELLEYRRHKLSLNGTREELSAFPLFDPHHIENILLYRKLLGEFISIYELQAVPGFNTQLLRQLAPYISISRGDFPLTNLKNAFRDGSRSFVVRPVIITQKAKGFRSDNNPAKFIGDRLGFVLRFKYRYRKQLQYGLTVEKDPGEELFTGRFPFAGDFQTAHMFVKDIGKVKTLALGDFTINMGQGLVHWQSQAFRKSASVLNVKRQGDLIKPYQSVGEYNFLRGIAVATALGNTELAVFMSRRMLTANIGMNANDKRVITSINMSGLHRSANERADRNSAGITSGGARLKWSTGNTTICWNVVYHRYSLEVEKRNEPYNIFSFKGSTWGNSSVDFATTIRNYHLFGEYAADYRKNPAVISGVVSSINRNLDAVFLFRHISRRYQSLYGNAFTENSAPTNEQGFYSGLSLRPATGWRVDTYMDLFRFHWLRYRVDAPSQGMHYFMQVTWKPSKTVECYWRVRNRIKPLNFDAEEPMDYPEMTTTKNWRTHVAVQLNKVVNVRGRLEMCTYQPSPGAGIESGYLYFTELTVKPIFRSYSFNMRLQYFEAESFNTRIYAYEKDLLMTTSIPAFQDRGFRYYLNISSKYTPGFLRGKQVLASLKLAGLTYFNKVTVGSGDSAIPGNTKNDIRFQVVII